LNVYVPAGHAIRKERERIWRFPVPISFPMLSLAV
jgi:hypothetical protein